MTSGSTTWTYTYNADGLRTKRTNGTDTYSYIYNGSKLTAMTKGSDTLYFTYDAAGNPLTVTYNDTVYYYGTNLQGDIAEIYNAAGTMVVGYRYNAYGELDSMFGSMADTLGILNPLRYRGYVYDTETKLYYLQSRYYNPEWGRFINADGFVTTGQGFVGNNMFAYCGNNPVMYVDVTGQGFITALFFGLTVVGITYLCTASDSNTIAVAYAQQLEKAKQKYNKNTVSINNNIDESEALVHVYINPNNSWDHGGPNIHIENSAYIRNMAEQEAILDVIIESPEFDPSVFKRGKVNWLREWRGHNIIFDLATGTTKERARHVDLNEGEDDSQWLVFDLF